MIKANAHKYSVSAMYRVLRIYRSTYYYKFKDKVDQSILVSLIKSIFKDSRQSYGTRRIKIELTKEGMASRMKISRIMKQEGTTM